MQRQCHFGSLRHNGDAVDHQRAVDDERTLAKNSSIGRPPAGMMTSAPSATSGRTCSTNPRAPSVACFVGEGAHEAGQIHLNCPHAGQPLLEAMSHHLPLVPIDERRVDGHKADPAAHAERREQIGLAQTDNGLSTAPRISRRPGS